MRNLLLSFVLSAFATKGVSALSSQSLNRRNFFQATTAAATASVAAPAFALDIDAFVNSAIDKPKEMTDDERTCKFAAPGLEKGEACERAGMPTSKAGKGVDAFGNIDRGDFVRCKTSYPMIDGKYVKTVTCE